ncbi:hypothetical protein SAMN05443637_11973 [Pseudonocardia thermophila]|jgi:hypothetical protein|uniref:Uncharacterized protein n=3 Tax=Pseudonocardia thermophila TaxID=1848 RepID=A0A1M6YAH9_PSETH|nr:hypothetical protein SAMN05443637_11973 [Pseudonocardia thermophila]
MSVIYAGSMPRYALRDDRGALPGSVIGIAASPWSTTFPSSFAAHDAEDVDDGEIRGRSALPELAARVAAGELDPYAAAHELERAVGM